jgi:hypothetical protein
LMDSEGGDNTSADPGRGWQGCDPARRDEACWWCGLCKRGQVRRGKEGRGIMQDEAKRLMWIVQGEAKRLMRIVQGEANLVKMGVKWAPK